MNKATTFSEFYDVLKMKALPGYNIGYADKNDTIFYISNGLIPNEPKAITGKKLSPGIPVKPFGLKPMILKNFPKLFNLHRVISTTQITVRFSLLMSQTIPIQRIFRKMPILKLITTTALPV